MTEATNAAGPTIEPPRPEQIAVRPLPDPAADNVDPKPEQEEIVPGPGSPDYDGGTEVVNVPVKEPPAPPAPAPVPVPDHVPVVAS